MIKKIEPFFLPLLTLLVVVGPYTIVPYVLDRFSAVHLPPTSCLGQEDGALFCEERYFDDGYVRFSSKKSDLRHCCIMERYLLHQERLSSRVLACAAEKAVSLDCGAVESYGLYRWRVDGADLSADLSWENHESVYVFPAR